MIEKRVALLNPEKIGLGLTGLSRSKRPIIPARGCNGSPSLFGHARGHGILPHMAGDVDYMLRVVVADMAAYDLFYKRLIDAIPLRKIRRVLPCNG